VLLGSRLGTDLGTIHSEKDLVSDLE
jgi:hypothetical protein